MHFIAIVLFSIAAAIFYGVLHDQVTARVCVEYFTIGHPPIFQTQSPTLLALGWGVVATWWVGLPLGLLLACASRLGSRPKLTVRQLVFPTGCLLVVMALAAVFFGWRGYVRASEGLTHLPPPLFASIPAERHAAFIADWFAHSASYAVGGLGGLVLTAWALVKRGQLIKNY